MADEQQAQDIENVLKARREACRDVVAALEARVAHIETLFASPGWRRLAAWYAARPENRVRELETRIADLEAERDDAKEMASAWEHAAQTQADALAAAEAERNELATRFDALVKDYDADTRAAEARCRRLVEAVRLMRSWLPGPHEVDLVGTKEAIRIIDAALGDGEVRA